MTYRKEGEGRAALQITNHRMAPPPLVQSYPVMVIMICHKTLLGSLQLWHICPAVCQPYACRVMAAAYGRYFLSGVAACSADASAPKSFEWTDATAALFDHRVCFFLRNRKRSRDAGSHSRVIPTTLVQHQCDKATCYYSQSNVLHNSFSISMSWSSEGCIMCVLCRSMFAVSLLMEDISSRSFL